MLSIIICSVNETYLKSVKENIEKTIGITYELLVWENTLTQLGICTVYNKLANEAKFDYLCFLHEDIIFKTAGWGSILLETFRSNSDVGLIGVAGGKYKSSLYGGWFAGVPGLDYYKIIHKNGEVFETLADLNYWDGDTQDVATIDGVFMVCSKSIWNQVQFNENLLKGFHFYDIDFSLRAAQIQKVVVTRKISILHATTGGDYGNAWVEAAFVFHDFAKKLLPFSTVSVAGKKVDHFVATYWLDWLKNFDISWRNKLKWIIRQRLLQDFALWYSILKFLLYRPLRLKFIHSFFK